MSTKHVLGLAFTAAALLPAVQGCSNPADALCCTEFKVGASIDASIGGSSASVVAVQAVADVAALTASAIADLTTACRGIAQDLGAPQSDQDAAEANTDANVKMKAWCAAAVAAIGTASAGVALTINVVPPVCSASISAKADCQAKCSGTAKCDVQANPPTCSGGTLEVECSGTCTAKAGATLSCTGTCDATCSGSCTAQGGVDCTGKCDGSCAAGGSTGGSGPQADGTCNGVCSGTCSVTAPNVTCSGSCSGTCSGTCTASAGASVKCDGDCSVAAQPISCTGGTLQGGCQVDAKCDANCDASVSAKASCTPASVDISANADGASALVDTLKANLPLVFGLKTKLGLVADATASFKDNIGAVTDIKVVCIPPIAAAVGQALTDIDDSVTASASITTSIGQ